MNALQVIRHQKQVSGARDPDIHPIDPSALSHIKPYDVIVCSPYKRCRRTAMEINKLLGANTQIIVDGRLSEYRTGNVHGKMDPESLKCGVIPTNEEWSDVQMRLDDALPDIQSIQGNVLVVTHGVVVKYYEQKLLGETQYKRGHDVPYIGGFFC